MRTYQIQINGKDYTVEIDDPNAPSINVRVNGKPFQVTVTEQSAATQVAPVEAGVEADAAYVPIVTPTFVDAGADLETDQGEGQPTASPGAATGTVIAPMPGRIMDIEVKVGQAVKQGDTLCNLEAMKMKSPIRSTADGTIAEVLISEGQTVSYGDVLFTFS